MTRRATSSLVIFLLLVAVASAFWALGGDPRMRMLMRNTVQLAGLSTLLSVAIGSVLALLLVRTDIPGRRLALLLLAALLTIPLYVQAVAWDAGFGKLGWYALPLDWLTRPEFQMAAAVWIHAVTAIPWVVLIVAAAACTVPRELEENALLDAGSWAVLRSVTLRRSALGMGVAATWVAVTTAGEMTITDIYAVRTYAEELYLLQALGEQPWPTLAPGMLLTGSLAGLALIAAMHWAGGRDAFSYGSQAVQPLGSGRWPGATVVWAVVLLLVAVPAVNLVMKMGLEIRVNTDAAGLVQRDTVWSLEHAQRVVMGGSTIYDPSIIERFGSEWKWSLLISTITACLALVVALPLGWYAHRRRRTLWVILPAVVCFAIPTPLVGLGIVQAMTWFDGPLAWWIYNRSLVGPVVAMLTKCLPWTLLICWLAMRSIPSELFESAALDGAGRWVRWTRIAVPQRYPALLMAWLAAFVLALGDLATSVLVVPPGVSTLAIRIFGLIHYGVDDAVAAICLVNGVLFALIGITLWMLLRRQLR